MAWTAKITRLDAATHHVDITFTEGVTGEVYAQQYEVPLGASATFLGDIVARVTGELTARTTVVQGAAVGAPVPPTPPPPAPVPGPNDALRASFSADFLKLKRLRVALNQGLIIAGDADLVATQTSVNTTFGANKAVLLDLINDRT